MKVLKKHKRAFGWKLIDIKGISHDIVKHKIILNDDKQMVRQPQRMLNPHMQEVVRKEVVKTLEMGIIFSI